MKKSRGNNVNYESMKEAGQEKWAVRYQRSIDKP